MTTRHIPHPRTRCPCLCKNLHPEVSIVGATTLSDDLNPRRRQSYSGCHSGMSTPVEFSPEAPE
jgi:hypothetical protein